MRPNHPHVVRLESRPANTEGSGAVTMRDLVRQALRMRPDRVVVGEVRGGEVVDLLAALNTGHEGRLWNGAREQRLRCACSLESLAMPAGLNRDGVRQVAAGLQAVVRRARRARDAPGGWSRCAGTRGDGLVRTVPAAIFRDDQVIAGAAAARLQK